MIPVEKHMYTNIQIDPVVVDESSWLVLKTNGKPLLYSDKMRHTTSGKLRCTTCKHGWVWLDLGLTALSSHQTLQNSNLRWHFSCLNIAWYAGQGFQFSVHLLPLGFISFGNQT